MLIEIFAATKEDIMLGEKRGKKLNNYVPDYVVFDLETTGTNPNLDVMIEISAVKVVKRQVTDTFSRLVNPKRPIPYYATAVNGITDEMVAGEPDIKEILPEFFAFIGDEILVGHNIHTFDMKFIWNAAEALFGRTVTNDYIDTLPMARQCLPQLSHHKLVDIASYYKISTAGAHRALNDCMMNQQCFEKMGEELEKQPKKLCPMCGGLLQKRSGRYGMFWGCSSFPQCRYTENF